MNRVTPTDRLPASVLVQTPHELPPCCLQVVRTVVTWIPGSPHSGLCTASRHGLFLRAVREGALGGVLASSSTLAEGGRQTSPLPCCQCCCRTTGMQRCPLVPLAEAGEPLLAPQVPRPTVHASPCQSPLWTVEMLLHSGSSCVGASSFFQKGFFWRGTIPCCLLYDHSRTLVRC